MSKDKVIFPSQEWVEKFVEKVNSNKEYEKAAKDWEGDFLFVIEPDGTGGLTETMTMYCDLWHGKCRKAFVVTPETGTPESEYEYRGKYSNWIKLLKGEIGPIKGLLARKFKLKGNMAKVLRAVKAAQELVRSTTMVENVEFM
ncbi:MAG: SCP2 sterol-binding domain-containing protein [Candidatus Heimdallarchaeota archaeon]